MRSQTQPTTTIANYCVNRLALGEPKIAGAYDLPKSSANKAVYTKPPKTELRRIDYRDPQGNPCTLHEAASYLGLGCSHVSSLFSKQNYRSIYKHHGINRKTVDYKDADGNKIAPSQLAKVYNCSPPTVSRLFAKHDGDYVLANTDLQAFKERADAKEMAL